MFMCGHCVEEKQRVTDGVEACEGVTEENDRLIRIMVTGMREGSMDSSKFCPNDCVCLAEAARLYQISVIVPRVVKGRP